MIVRPIVAAVLIGIAAPALAAAKWVPFYNTDNGAKHYIDTESMKLVRAGFWRVWVKSETTNVKDVKSKYIVRQLSFDCENDTMLIGSGVAYYEAGVTRTLEAETRSMPVVPDTIGGEISTMLCKEAVEQANKTAK